MYFFVGMMCSLKKNAVIFQVGSNAKDPIIVIEQKDFTKQEPDSSVPLLGIYNGYHFQSVLPASKEDEELTVEIVKYFPNFQGNFKSFLAHKGNHQKLKRDLVSTIVQENSSSEHVIFQSKPTKDGTSSSCDVAFSEESNFEIDAKDIEAILLGQKNPENKVKTDGMNIKYEAILSEQSKSQNEVTDFGTVNILEKENEGINGTCEETNLRLENSENKGKNEEKNINTDETAFEQENYENEINHDRISTNYKEPALETENSENEANNEETDIINKPKALEKENSPNEAKYVEISRTYIEPGLELEDTKIGVENEQMSSSYEASDLKPEKSISSSYEEQRTEQLYASNKEKKGGGQNLFISKDNKVMH